MATISKPALVLPKGIFKAYDIRGLYPGEINARTAALIVEKLAGKLSPKKVLIGRDARLSSPVLYGALKKTLLKRKGQKVISAGIMTTPMFYFLVNYRGADLGIMVTASHNPKEYNGLKIVRQKAIPISGEDVYRLVNS